MELNEITSKLPPHLLQFVVEQPYQQYTPVDQAVWRYVMRRNFDHLAKVAHHSYVDGLHKAGIGIESIPTLYGMNRILKQIGWAAVAVDGFIPPGAFMEFTAYKVLVIAADIRSLDHIEYTPAPDIIHESAGHAPIIANPDFAAYLIEIGKAGSKAFSSRKDNELYEAIRHLSIIKEDPSTPQSSIEAAESAIQKISTNMGAPSEMALLRNLHWWTVEYGLIGTLDDYRIYGAGLLSSIGEGVSCMKPEVKKIPYSIQAAQVVYDITRPQPQLFVTPDFEHLSRVLKEFEATMAFKTGGISGMKKAIASESTGTAVLNTGLQLSGTFVVQVINKNDKLVFFRTAGPSALAREGKQLADFGKKQLPQGCCVLLGEMKPVTVPGDEMHFLQKGKFSMFETEDGVKIEGILQDWLMEDEVILLVRFMEGRISLEGNMLIQGDVTLALADEVLSVFAGPADVEAFELIAQVPKEKTHKIRYKGKVVRLHKLYQMVRDIREKKYNVHLLPKIASMLQSYFPDDWLLNLEILELTKMNGGPQFLIRQLEDHLIHLSKRIPSFNALIRDGMNLIK